MSISRILLCRNATRGRGKGYAVLRLLLLVLLLVLRRVLMLLLLLVLLVLRLLVAVELARVGTGARIVEFDVVDHVVRSIVLLFCTHMVSLGRQRTII